MKVKGIAKLLSVIMAMTCISFPAISHAEETTSTEATTALKQKIFINGNWGDYIETFAYAVGFGSQWMDYSNTEGSTFADGIWSAQLNDNTLDESALLTRPAGWKGEGKVSNPETGAENMIDPATGWGYKGFKIISGKSDSPFTAGVIDARDYADNGAISYVINADGENLDDVYLTVGYHSNLIDLGWWWGGTMEQIFSWESTYLDADKLDEIKAPDGTNGEWRLGTGEYQRIRFAGVPLKDYYDTQKGGFQTITVPFSAFTDNSSFNKYAGKSTGNDDILVSADHNKTFNPALIKTVGIARKDSGTKGVSFTSQIKDIAIVAPSAVRNFAGEYNAQTGAVNLTWEKSTDSDISKVQVKKTSRGKTEYIDLSLDQTSYTDTIATKAEVKYSVVVTDSTYGATAASEEFVVNERATTTALKKRMMNNDGGNWSYQLEELSGHVGVPSNIWWDYSYETVPDYSNKILTASINDNTLTTAELDTNGNNPQNEIAKNMIEPKTGWGFRGIRISNYDANSNPLPCGVVDLLDYEDGYAVFNVRIDEGSLDGVYAAIGYYNSFNDIDGMYREVDGFNSWEHHDMRDTELLDNVYGKDAWKSMSGMGQVRFAGVPLADYYDTSIGGFQTIRIPLSRFTTSPSFRCTYDKSGAKPLTEDDAYKNNYNLNLGLVKAMGIVRQDTDPDTASTFTFSTKDYAFVAPTASSEPVAEYTADGVKISWVETTDTDTEQILVKERNRQKQYINVTGDEYLDTDMSADDEAVYYLITRDTAYGTEAVSQKAYYNTPEAQNELVSDMQAGYSKDRENMKTDDSGNVLPAIPYKWYSGESVNAWGEYMDYWGFDSVKDSTGRQTRYWLVDSDYVYKSTESAGKGRIIKDSRYIDDSDNDHGLVSHEYGMGGYEYNANVEAVKDISAHQGGYLVMDISFSEPNGNAVNLDGSYFTVEFAKDSNYIADSIIVRGVPAKDYYDTAIGGYQRVLIPLSAFTNAAEPELKHVKIREYGFTGLLADDNANNYDFANYMHMFKGAGVARKNLEKASGIMYDIRNMYIVDTAAPRNLSADFDGTNVNLTWKDAPVDNVSKYEIYRDGRRLTVVDGTSYTDTTAKSGDHTYEVKTVSPTYENIYSAAATAQVTVPASSSIVIYAGTGADRTATKYIQAGTMEADLMAAAANTRGYAALYDENGVLKSVKTAALGSNTAQTISFANVLATDTLKAFIWNSDMTPLCDEETVGPRGTTVIVIGDEVAAQAVDYLDEIGAAAGTALNVTSVYASNAKMNNHYTNMVNDEAVYTKSVNGSVKADLVSLGDVIAEDEWDYAILQDNTIYNDIETYYDADNGAYLTEVRAIIAKIKEASPSVKIYASQPTGFDKTFYDAQSEEFKTIFDQNLGVTEDADLNDKFFFNASAYASQLSAFAIAECADNSPVGSEYGYIDSHDLMSGFYKGTATFINVKNLTEDGKFFTAAYIYRAIADGAKVTDTFVPSGVTDAEGILTIVNG